MKALGWTVLALVFVDELLALAALAVWGCHAGGIAVAVIGPAAWAAAWFLFAAPGARYGGRIARPAVKVIAFGLACLALRAAGYAILAIALLVFSAGINGLAELPAIPALQAARGNLRHDVADPAGHGIGGRGLPAGSAVQTVTYSRREHQCVLLDLLVTEHATWPTEHDIWPARRTFPRGRDPLVQGEPRQQHRSGQQAGDDPAVPAVEGSSMIE